MNPNIVICVVSTFYTFLSITSGQIIFPTFNNNKTLVTKLSCKLDENRPFRFVETTQIGKKPNDTVKVEADVFVICLGYDKDGKYGSEGLKYLVIITEIEMGGKLIDSYKEKANISSEDWKELHSVPFHFVQLANGSIPEVRFSKQEVTTGGIRNFKRRLVDAFQTSVVLESTKGATTLETSLIGEYTSSYKITENGKAVSQLVLADKTITVEKSVTEDNIVKLIPTKAVNDLENMDLLIKQKQLFKNGNMISSSGTYFLDPFLIQNSKNSNYKKQDVNASNSFRFPVSSTFDMHLSDNKAKIFDSARIESARKMEFISTSRFGEEDGEPYWGQLKGLHQSAGDMNKFVKNLVQPKAKNYEVHKTTLLSIVIREIYLKADKDAQSGCAVIRKTIDKKTLETICTKKNTACKDFARLLASAGGPKAESVFLSLLNEKTSLSLDQQRMIADTLSYFSQHSAKFLDSLIKLKSKKGLDKHIKSSVVMAIGTLGSHTKVQIKDKIAKEFVSMLKKHKDDCKKKDFFFLLDILEATGNLGSEKTVSLVLEVSKTCEKNPAIQIACVHAVRRQIILLQVEKWLENKITNYNNCFMIEGITDELQQTIQDQKISGDTVNWPRNGFNKIDENLNQLLKKSSCSEKNIISYFSKKKDQTANDIAEKFFRKETDSWSSHSKKHFQSNNSQYDLDKIDTPKINVFYKQEKYGPDYLNIKASNGLFVDYDVKTPPNFKFLAKFISDVNVFGFQRDVATLYVFIGNDYVKAYIRILGFTFYEKTFDACPTFDVTKFDGKVIPVVSLPVGIFTVNLGIVLTNWISLYTKCSEKRVFQFGHTKDYEYYGEANAIVLNTKVATTVGGNITYRYQYNFKPLAKMCFSGNRGYDPVTVSFKGYMQIWDVKKFQYGPGQVWNHSFLPYNVTGLKMSPLFDEKCFRHN